LLTVRCRYGKRDIARAISHAGDVGLRTVRYRAAMVILKQGCPRLADHVRDECCEEVREEAATVALARGTGVILHRMWWESSASLAPSPPPRREHKLGHLDDM
jgi:hypothetical protein